MLTAVLNTLLPVCKRYKVFTQITPASFMLWYFIPRLISYVSKEDFIFILHVVPLARGLCCMQV